MIKQVLKYQGNGEYICILALNEKDELFIFYALTRALSIDMEKESQDYEIDFGQRFIFNTYQNYEINIPIKPTKQNHMFHILKISDESEYAHICSVVESLV